jgi:hypothetical protein
MLEENAAAFNHNGCGSSGSIQPRARLQAATRSSDTDSWQGGWRAAFNHRENCCEKEGGAGRLSGPPRVKGVPPGGGTRLAGACIRPKARIPQTVGWGEPDGLVVNSFAV